MEGDGYDVPLAPTKNNDEDEEAWIARENAWRAAYEEPDQDDDETNDDYYNRRNNWRDARPITQPEPGEFKSPLQRLRSENKGDIENFPDCENSFAFKSFDLRGNFRKLQVIVKLANIHLTPKKSSYGGVPWHVEGQLNEAM